METQKSSHLTIAMDAIFRSCPRWSGTVLLSGPMRFGNVLLLVMSSKLRVPFVHGQARATQFDKAVELFFDDVQIEICILFT